MTRPPSATSRRSATTSWRQGRSRPPLLRPSRLADQAGRGREGAARGADRAGERQGHGLESVDHLDHAAHDDVHNTGVTGHHRPGEAGRGRLHQHRAGDAGLDPPGAGHREVNSAAFALEIAWLKLLADAGCLTDDQHKKAVEQVTAYTAALQAQLKAAGYYTGEVDGIYGPLTVDAVQKLQTKAGLPTTGLVDKASALALDKKLASTSPSTPQPQSQTAAVQTVLKLTGYWTGPVDGIWTDALTDALMDFKTALGVEPTGVSGTRLIWLPWQQARPRPQSVVATTTTTAGGSATTTSAAPTTTASSDDDDRADDHLHQPPPPRPPTASS